MRAELTDEHGYYLVAVDQDAEIPHPRGEGTAERPRAAGAAQTLLPRGEGTTGPDCTPGEKSALLPRGEGTTPDCPALLGYAGLRAPRGGSQADVQTIAVAPEVRGWGLGRGLMHALIAETGRRSIPELFLEVRADNAVALALYRSLGFVEISVRRRYYNDGGAAIVMRLQVPATRMQLAGSDRPGETRS
ncbi:MAG: hypothetical protein B5766_11825 [Candidatus Lumbricidophila eiseniae]|uniref:N-acetyltransferase domain-containing protein n=1 Tax=Candidatus Lumbricidiphila eiseniae TaxID=1969409 RepID=A0A2A6FP65_9MICO|nr:MAG: hypothetical protein B5766_11825 [Candidatus Lumbricidophila eiseniae]